MTTATLPHAPPRILAGVLFEIIIIDVATSLPCPWTLARLAPWLGWSVVPVERALLHYVEELDEAEEAVATIGGGGYGKWRYPKGLTMATVAHEYYE